MTKPDSFDASRGPRFISALNLKHVNPDKAASRAERHAYLQRVLSQPFAHDGGDVQIEILAAVVDLLEIEQCRAPWWRRLWRRLKGCS